MRAAVAANPAKKAVVAADNAATAARIQAGRADVLAEHLHAAFDDTRDRWAGLRLVGRIVGWEV
ncbi:MAG: hypothetical protein M3370_13070 [Actinomycetota bacterium]|nr:hypothetical protein [Actinomycetota bacterium]